MRRALLVLLLAVVSVAIPPSNTLAQAGTEFPGTVLMVDPATGRFAVKKDSGGTRFTFVANDKTQFEGSLKSIKDLKNGDKVIVLYQVTGPQYIALKVSLKK